MVASMVGNGYLAPSRLISRRCSRAKAAIDSRCVSAATSTHAQLDGSAARQRGGLVSLTDKHHDGGTDHANGDDQFQPTTGSAAGGGGGGGGASRKPPSVKPPNVVAGLCALVQLPRDRQAANMRSRKLIVLYLALAYGLSWAWLMPMAKGGVVRAGVGWPTHLPALLGPLLAAVVVTARFDGRQGLSDLGRRMVLVRVPARWWAFAVSPLLVLLAVLAVDVLAGQPSPAVNDFAVFSGVPAGWGVLGVAATVLLVAVWHTTYNLISGTAAATGLLAAVSTTLVIGLAAVLVVLEVRATRAGRDSVLGPVGRRAVLRSAVG